MARRRDGAAAALVLASGALLLAAAPVAAQVAFPLFESGPVRPVALSPDGERLFVANIPEAHLEIFDVLPDGTLEPAGSVPVGLEPVAVAARNDNEVWVVNHLSDSVSIVDVASDPPRVERTLLVGDEPRDIVFAGSPKRAFISTAHRGQHRTHPSIAGAPGAGDPQLTTEGVGRADVWVFSAFNQGDALGGVPLRILEFFADTPRALATDGTTVYVAAFASGNQTTVVHEEHVPDGFATACGAGGEGLGVPGPDDDASGEPAPETAVIVKFDGSNWVDALGCSWDGQVTFSLPDHDVFAVDAGSFVTGPSFDHVGTLLYNMAVNPVSGKVLVTNVELRNDIRFEGPGVYGGSTVQGRFAETRISVLDPAGPSVDPQHLNLHIDYDMLHTDPGADHAAIDAQIPHSLSTPLDVVVSGDPVAPKVYVAAFGSAKVGVFDAATLEDPSFESNFDPTVASAGYIATGGGPAGLALNDAGDRLYVYTRFDNRVEVIRLGGPNSRLQVVQLPSAEPASVTEGRPFLYDATVTSGNGEPSCHSCHVFGDVDQLAWNLGNPDEHKTFNPQLIIDPLFISDFDFHPMKGPMTTQTMRGLATHGAMHWRGDRSNGAFNPSPVECTVPNEGDCDEEVSMMNFIVAFEGLQGHEGLISAADMQKLTDFSLQILMPPNPVANLDGSLTPDQSNGLFHWFNREVDGQGTCNDCHRLDPAQGFFAADGVVSFGGAPELLKVPHLRNMYTKVGMFGFPGENGFLGDQVRGFGFIHDGAFDTIFNFLEVRPFDLFQHQSRDVEEFMFAFPSDLAPIVGQQVSIGPGSPLSFGSADVNGRISLLDARAAAPFDSLILGSPVTECDLIASTVEGGAVRHYLRQSDGSFQADDGSPALSESDLRAKADPEGAGQDIVYTCVVPGSGERMGLDRDADSVWNGLDNCPAWPNGPALGTCTAGDPALRAAKCSASTECGTGGACSMAQEDADSDDVGDACEISLLPEPSGAAPLGTGAALLLGLRRARRRATRPSPARRRRAGAGSCGTGAAAAPGSSGRSWSARG